MRKPPAPWGRTGHTAGRNRGTGVADEGRHRRDDDSDVPWYESRRKVRRFPPWLGPAVAVGGVALLVAGTVLFGSSAVPEKITGSSTCDGPRATARIAAAP